MKRILEKILKGPAKLFLLILVVSIVVLTVGAVVNGDFGGVVTWTFDDDTGELTISGSGEIPDFAFGDPYGNPFHTTPEGVGYRPEQIYSVIIDDRITAIGNGAFYDCWNLSSVVLPDALETIGDYAFAGCPISSVYIPDSVTGIGNGAFEYHTTLITYYKTAAGVWARENYHAQAYIPHEPTMAAAPPQGIDEYIYVFSIETGIPDNEGLQFDITPDLPYGMNFADGSDDDHSGIIPGTIYGLPRYLADFTGDIEYTLTAWNRDADSGADTYIAEVSFALEVDSASRLSEVVGKGIYYNDEDQNTPLYWLLLDNGVLELSGVSERYTGLRWWGPIAGTSPPTSPWHNYRHRIEEVVLSQSVPGIGSYAFYGCTELRIITIPDGLDFIGDSAFSGCSSLADIEIPASVSSIGQYAFYRCSSLEEIVIPEGVTEISRSSFSGCESLTGVDIPSTVIEIGRNAFYDCVSLEGITIPANVKTIGQGAFANSGLAAIIIPEGVTSIGTYAFLGNPSLVSVGIPSSMESIGDNVFGDCRILERIEVTTGNTDYASDAGVLYGGASETLLLYPPGKTDSAYVIPASAVSIERDAFGDNDRLKSIYIPAGVTDIGEQALHGCSLLEHITVHADNPEYTDIDGVLYSKDLSELILYPPRKEKTVIYDIPDGVTNFNIGELSANAAFEEIRIPDSVTNISNTYITYRYFYSEDSDAGIAGLPPPTIVDLYPAVGRILAHYDSYAIWWAKQNGYQYTYLACERTMRANPPDVLYKYIPYEFVIKTAIPDNEGIVFSITSEHQLPNGMTLVPGPLPDAEGRAPGTIYGSPLDYTDFVGGVDFTITARPAAVADRDIYRATAYFTLTLADTPDFRLLNADSPYDIVPDHPVYGDGHIGVLNSDTSEYEITGVWEDYSDDQIFKITGEFDLFHSFWINGIRQTEFDDFDVDDGSTKVTIFAQTIKELGNGEYTAVAAFYKDDGEVTADNAYAEWNQSALGENNLDIVAQQFTVNFSDNPNVDTGSGNNEPGNNDPSNNDTGNYGYYGDYDYGSYNSDVTTPGEEGIADQVRNDDSGDTSPGGTMPEGTTPGGTDPNDTTPGDTAPGGTTPGGTAPGGAAPGGQGIADQVRNDDGSTTSGGTTPVGTAFSGLPVGPDGNFYFDLDGSGNPMVLRIDMPFEEFEDLLMDGQLWAPGTDYAVTSGSTVITIGADRLERLDAGMHTLAADFASETVEIVFMLNKPGSAGASPSAPGGAASSAVGGGAGDITMPAQNSGALPFIIAGAVVVVLAAAVTLIVRKKRAA